MKLKKIFASAFAAVAAITSVASLTSCKKDDDVTDDGGNDQGGNENDAAAEIQAKLEAAINGLSVKSSYEADFTLSTTAAGGVTISWASDNVNVVKIENGKATVTRPGLTEADATVKLTATAVIDGETKTKEFTITIPHVADQSKTIAAIKELELGAVTAAKGVVTGFVYAQDETETRSGFYLTDSTGTIYIYGMNVAKEVALGDEVYLNGTFDRYFGTPQLKSPTDLVKLGSNKTADFSAAITDKTVTDIASSVAPEGEKTTTPTTIHTNVYDMIVFFEKKEGTGDDGAYLNYRVCDPENLSNYVNIYFKNSPGPDETYEFTEEYNKYANTYCRVKYVVNGTSSSGKWRGHVLSFTELTNDEKAKLLLVEATRELPQSVYVPSDGLSYELGTFTLPEGCTLNVTSSSEDVTYADGKINIAQPAENTNVEIKFAIKLGDVTVTEYTKTIGLSVTATDITSKVTIENGYITIPYDAITGSGLYSITLETGKVINIEYNGFVDKSSYDEIGLAAGKAIKISTSGVKLDALISDVFGSYDNMKCYVGTAANGTAITATKGTGKGTTYTYLFDSASDAIYFVDDSNYDVAFYGFQLVVEGSYVAPEEPEIEVEDGLVTLTSSLFPTAYPATTDTLVSGNFTWEFASVANYGSGIQMKKQAGTIYNTTALTGKITKIEFEWNSTKTVYDNENAVKIELGTDNTYAAQTLYISTVKDQKSYSLDITGEYTFIKISNNIGFAEYWDSIKVTYDGEAPEEPLVPSTPSTPVEPEEPEVIESTIANAITVGSAKEHDTYTTDYYKLTGVITEVKNTTFGNVYISDGTNSIYIFGLNDANGTRYDAMATKPVVGDTIVVQGVLGIYNGIVQIKNGTLISLTQSEATDADKAEEEALRLAGLIADLYDETTEINLSSSLGTVVITPQAGATTLEVNGTTLTVTPGTAEVTETITITVTVGEASFTTEAISVKSKPFTITEGDFTATVEYTSSTSTSMNADSNNALLLGLKSELFNVKTNLCGSYQNPIGLNKDGTIRLYSNSDGNGSLLTIKGAAENYTVVINKITITFGSTVNSFTVNGEEGAQETTEYEIYGPYIQIKNTTAESSKPVYIKQIIIDYSVHEKTDGERAQEEKLRLEKLIESTYDEVTEIELTSEYGTVEVIPQEGAKTISFNNGILTITPSTEDLTETFDIKVTVGESFSRSYPSLEITVLAAPIVNPTIDEVITSDAGEYTTSGTVIGVTKVSFIIKDETGAVLVYKGKSWTSDVEIGDVVTVTGTTSKYNGLMQFGTSTSYTKDSTVTVEHPTSAELDSTGLTALLTATPEIQYITYTGILSQSGDFYNVTVDGTTAVGSIVYPVSATELTALSGQRIKVTGYFVGISSSKYINTIVTEYEVIPFTEEEKVDMELDRLVSLIKENYDEETTIDLSSTVATVVVTLQTGATTLTVTDNVLKVTPTVNAITETVTISVTVGETTKTTEAISITSVKDREEISVDTTYSFNSSDTTVKDNYIVVPATVYAQKSSINFEHLAIDASTGKLSDNSGTWFQFNNTTEIKFTVSKAATVQLKMYEDATTYTVNGVPADATHIFNVAAGEVTIVSTADMYIGYIYVTFEKIIEVDTTYSFNSADTTVEDNYYVVPASASVQNGKTTYEHLTIDAYTGKLGDNSGTWFQFNESTTISFKVAKAATVQLKMHADATTYTVNGVPADATHTFEVAAGEVTIASTADDTYIGYIYITFEEEEPALAATFTLGTDDTTIEGEKDGSEISSYTETSGNYVLTLSNLSKVYHKTAYDAAGNAVFKLGTSSVVGSFSFTVVEDVKKVVIYVAGYKSNNAKISINGGETQTITTYSATPEYTPVVVDTTTNKTVTFTTVSGGVRCKINTIEFYA